MVKGNPKMNLGKNNNEKAKGSEIGFFFCAKKRIFAMITTVLSKKSSIFFYGVRV